MSFFREMGVIAYPLTIVLILLLVQTVRGSLEVARSEKGDGASLRLHSILILGVLGACLGLLGTLVGVYLAAGFLSRAGEVSSGLVWGGIRVALGSSIVGFLMLGFASLAWLVLHYLKGRREAAAA